MTNPINKIISVIRKSRGIFIAGHERPDGDTAGSSLALAHALRPLGKKIVIRTKENLPEYLKFLPGSAMIKKGKAGPRETFDASVILECSDMARMGGLITRERAGTIVNIDHHLVSSPFGDINWIVPSAGATAQLVLELLTKMRLPVAKPTAVCLYAGILTDTGKFTQKNTAPEILEDAARLMRAGADPEKITAEVYGNKSAGELKLMARALASLKTYLGGKLAVVTLTEKDFAQTGTTWRDTEGFVNHPLALKGAEAAAFIRHINGAVKVSMRSRNIDLTPLVGKYGGGGHKHAAGFSLDARGKSSADCVKRAARLLVKEAAGIV